MSYTAIDYETLETILGNYLRTADNYDMDSAHFFPIGFLDRLFHFSQDLSVVESRKNPGREVNAFGSLFDRWIDDMVASTTLFATNNTTGETTKIKLIDVAEMLFSDDETSPVKIILNNDNEAILTNEDGTALHYSTPEQIIPTIEFDYDRRGASQLHTMEYLASLFHRAGRSLNIKISNETRDSFIEPVFKFFKFDLSNMVPELAEDLETILDEQLITLQIP